MKIFGIAGKNGSGKTSLINHIYNKLLNNILDCSLDFWLNESGELIASEKDSDVAGVINVHLGFNQSDIVLDHIKDKFDFFSLLDPIKLAAHTFFNLELDKLNGSAVDRNALTIYTVGDMYGKAPKGRPLKDLVSYEEFIQCFAKKLKDINPEAIRNSIRSYLNANSEILFILDISDDIDISLIKSLGGKVFKLTRSPYNEESSLDTIDNSQFDAIIDNANCHWSDFHNMVDQVLHEHGCTL